MKLISSVELEDIVGAPIDSLTVQPLQHNGYSGAQLERMDIQLRDGRRERLVRKRVRLAGDWTAYLTEDIHGREAMLLGEPRLCGVWEVFDSPYLGCTSADGELVLLMRDLTECFLPDVNAPLDLADEDRLLDALARLHARYWRCDLLEQLDWLARPRHLLSVMGPKTTSPTPHLLLDMVRSGWNAAIDMLPKRVAHWLLEEPFAQSFAGLPHTLVHGDAKVANFALLPGLKVAALDWAWIGAAPCTVDLGWYFGVNATRLARSKEEVVTRYRVLLEAALGEALPDAVWHRLRDVAIITGARMLLWQKALAARGGERGAEAEFAWWVEALEQVV